jgi:lyso-ornithine lipid O-acyltransferase
MNDLPAEAVRVDGTGSRARAVLRLAGYFLITISLLPVQVVAHAFRLPLSRRLPRFYHRACCRLLGFDIAVRGAISTAHPTLFVSNHVSYVDIAVLGALTDASFIAKAEIARWPFFGYLARLQRSVFVDRRLASTARQRDEIGERLEAGDNLVLFPEGTSDDGATVLPFKTALFAVARLRPRGEALTVQPVSITYTSLDGIPMGRLMRPMVAWYGDMALMPHLWRLIGLGRVGVTVEFHPPVRGDAFDSRKELSDHCWRVIAGGVQATLSGRAAPVPARR